MGLKTPDFWYDLTPTPSSQWRAMAMAPLSGIYALGMMAAQCRPLPRKLDVPVICIGNFIAGGAGKTPVAMAVMDMIRKRGLAKNPCFLSRGYGGSLSGPVQIDPARHQALDTGDEPLLLARIAPTFIARNRYKGALVAVAAGHDLIVMDDGLLNRSIRKTVSLAVIDGRMGIGNGMILPAGPLRAPLHAGLRAADGVILVGADRSGVLSHIPPDKPCFTVTMDPVPPPRPAQSYIAFCGIGYPQKFRDSLTGVGLTVDSFIPFPDHHVYTAKDFEKLNALASRSGARLITTAKDAVKIAPALAPMGSFDILEQRPRWEAAADDALVHWLSGKLT
jgi:tetraacyldisaccharide 4'-kinase